MFGEFVVDIILRCHHRCCINGQLYRVNVADNNHHATGLRTPRPLGQLRLVTFSHIGNGNQRACIIIQPQLARPEASHIRRDDQLCHDIVFLFVVLADFIQRMTPDFINELCLTGAWLRQRAATITDSHRSKVHFFTTRHSGSSQLFSTGSGNNCFEFFAHYSSLFRVNRNNVAVICHTAGVHIARYVLDNIQTNQVSAGRFCIRN